MESTLVLLGGCGGGDGGGGSPGVSAASDSTMSKLEALERGHVGMMVTEEPSYQTDTELELGLGLSVGGGGVGKVKSSGWGERCRILTAKDFPSVASHGGSSSSPSCRFSGRSTNIAPIGSVSGTKRAADSVSLVDGSPTSVSQVVGWPPIRAYRMNSLVNQAKTQRAEEETEKEISEKEKSKDCLKKKICDGKRTNYAPVKGKENMGFVKVNMDGVLIGRKVDLNAHSCYETLAQMLEDMFFEPSGTHNSTGGDKEQAGKLPKLLDGNSEFVLTYEDKDGDWMLVGDVPFRMFVSSVKKLRIMRTAEANGLAPRSQERSERQRIRPI